MQAFKNAKDRVMACRTRIAEQVRMPSLEHAVAGTVLAPTCSRVASSTLCFMGGFLHRQDLIIDLRCQVRNHLAAAMSTQYL